MNTTCVLYTNCNVMGRAMGSGCRKGAEERCRRWLHWLHSGGRQPSSPPQLAGTPPLLMLMLCRQAGIVHTLLLNRHVGHVAAGTLCRRRPAARTAHRHTGGGWGVLGARDWVPMAANCCCVGARCIVRWPPRCGACMHARRLGCTEPHTQAAPPATSPPPLCGTAQKKSHVGVEGLPPPQRQRGQQIPAKKRPLTKFSFKRRLTVLLLLPSPFELPLRSGVRGKAAVVTSSSCPHLCASQPPPSY